VVDSASAWLHALMAHPLPDLRARVTNDRSGT
jgi:hypothetical protein